MKFSDVIGHEQAKEYLRGLVRDNNIPHSLMISGIPGIGKMQLALAFAQCMHCTDRHDGDSCGKCPSCRQHMSLNFPDLIFVYPVQGTKGSRQLVSDDFSEPWREFLSSDPLATYSRWLECMGAENAQPQIKVTESDEIIRKMSLSNFSADTKIMLVWLPEKLHPAAANKLLKIIEEPPEGNMFLFVSNSPSDILPTIYSRTQRLPLKPLEAELISSTLSMQYSVDPAKAAEIAAASSGSLGKSLEMVSADNESSEFRELFHTLARKAFLKDIDSLKEWSDKAASLKREKSRRLLDFMARQIRGTFMFNIGMESISSLSAEDCGFSRNFKPYINPGNIGEFSSIIAEASRDIAANGNARIVFFDLALQFILLLNKH